MEDNKQDLLQELLKKLKQSIGVLYNDTSLDSFYGTKLQIAINDYLAEDISESVLATEYGKDAVVLYAIALINQVEIATNPTIIFTKNKLSLLTKGERVENA